MLLLNPIENDLAILFRMAKLDLRFVHGRAEKCIRNGAHILGRNRQGKYVTMSQGEKGLFICRHIYLCK